MNEDVLFIHNRILCSHKKEGNPAVCNNLDESRGHHMLSEISQTEKDKSCVISHMWNLKKPSLEK